MAAPPQEAVWPIGRQEHATQLTKYLQDTLECIVRKNDTPIPPDLVISIIRGTLSFIAKTQNTPDMTTVRNKLNIMHTEQDQIAKEIANIKEEPRRTMAGVQESNLVAKKAKTAEYRYSPLSQNPDTIRLLRLLPGKDKLENVQCELFEYTLRESSATSHLYEALSYVWGSEENPKFITVDDQKLAVTQNLYVVLLRLRDDNIPRIIWVDAVCINQANAKEKEHQILLLPAIYAKANRVVVWLGEACNDSDKALEAIRRASTESTQLFNGKPSEQEIERALQTIHIANEKHNKPFSLYNTRQAPATSIFLSESSVVSSLESSPKKEPFLLSIRLLLQRRWFKRIWVRARKSSKIVEVTKLLYRFCKKWLPPVMF